MSSFGLLLSRSESSSEQQYTIDCCCCFQGGRKKKKKKKIRKHERTYLFCRVEFIDAWRKSWIAVGRARLHAPRATDRVLKTTNRETWICKKKNPSIATACHRKENDDAPASSLDNLFPKIQHNIETWKYIYSSHRRRHGSLNCRPSSGRHPVFSYYFQMVGRCVLCFIYGRAAILFCATVNGEIRGLAR